jgi:hypothetical protein
MRLAGGAALCGQNAHGRVADSQGAGGIGDRIGGGHGRGIGLVGRRLGGGQQDPVGPAPSRSP